MCSSARLPIVRIDGGGQRVFDIISAEERMCKTGREKQGENMWKCAKAVNMHGKTLHHNRRAWLMPSPSHHGSLSWILPVLGSCSEHSKMLPVISLINKPTRYQNGVGILILMLISSIIGCPAPSSLRIPLPSNSVPRSTPQRSVLLLQAVHPTHITTKSVGAYGCEQPPDSLVGLPNNQRQWSSTGAAGTRLHDTTT